MDQNSRNGDNVMAAVGGYIVGDTGFTIRDIVWNLSRNTTVEAVLRRNWTHLCRSLDVTLVDRMTLDDDLCHNRKNIMDVVENIITLWKSKNGQGATMYKLVNSFKEVGMVDAAEILETMQTTSANLVAKNIEYLDKHLSKHTRNRKNGNDKGTDGSTVRLMSLDDSETRSNNRLKAYGRENLYCTKSLTPRHIKIILVLGIALFVIVPLAYIYKHLYNMAFINDKNVSSSTDTNSPSLVAVSEANQPTQNSKLDVNADSSSNCDTKSYISIHVFSLKEYENKIIVASSSCVNLTISISNPSDWPSNSNMLKAEQVRVLKLIGTISQKLFLSLLSQATQIKEIYISNDKNGFCKHIQRSRDTQVTPHKSMYTSKIQSIVLSGFSVCAHFYKHFGIYLRFENLLSISFINSVFTNSNIIHIENIMYQSEKTLQNLEINGMSNTTQHFYNPSKVLREVKRLKLDINTMFGSVITQVSLLEINFCASFPNLEIFESTTGVTYSDILLVLKCKKLKVVSSTVIFGERDGFWNMNESVKSKYLRSLTLHFIFSGDCPSHQQIKQLGLNEEIKGVIKTVSTNKCSISADTGDNEEVIFVEEYSKT